MSMAAKPFWRRIDLITVSFALWGLIALVTGWYWPAVRWSLDALPGYLRGDLGAPYELTLLDEAETALAAAPPGRFPPHVRSRLERVVAIDPTSRGVPLLGECLLQGGDPDGAARLFRRHLAVDPWEIVPYLRLAEIERGKGRPGSAAAILRQGIDWFAACRETWRPRPDPTAPAEANAKADMVFQLAEAHHARLTAELASWTKGIPVPEPLASGSSISFALPISAGLSVLSTTPPTSDHASLLGEQSTSPFSVPAPLPNLPTPTLPTPHPTPLPVRVAPFSSQPPSPEGGSHD